MPLNGDVLDLRAKNLAMTPKLRQAERSVRFLGVTWHAPRRKWRVQIRDGEQRRFLGCFDDPTEAAHAYDRAAVELRGAGAILNFPPAPVGPAASAA